MREERKPVGIIGAMDVEIEAILSAAEIEKTERYSSTEFHIGTLSGTPVVVAYCCAGKVNSALCAQAMIDRYSPCAVINVGVAGGVGADVRIGDIVIAESCVQYDYDTTAIEESPIGTIDVPGQGDIRFFPCAPQLADALAAAAQGLYGRCHRGVVATGDRFVADPEFGVWLHQTFGALACEMEGASIAHVCFVNQVPCAVLRSISDNGNDDAVVDFPAFAQESAHKAQKLLQKVLTLL